jgi:hypothetical protein
MDTRKPSYKSIVCEELREEQEVTLEFHEWDEVVCQIDKHTRQHATIDEKSLQPINIHFMNNLADFITDITLEVREYYGFHGVANDITVNKVIDCFKDALVIDVVDESLNDNSSDDDDTIS